MKWPSEFSALAVVGLTAAVAVVLREYRAQVIVAGLVVLIALMMVQFFANRLKTKRLNKEVEAGWFDFGEITLSGNLLVGDKWDYSEAASLRVPAGIYRVKVLAEDDGRGRAMTAGLVLLSASTAAFEPKVIEVSVDTGVLFLLDAETGISSKDVKKMTLAMLNREANADPGVVVLTDASGMRRGVAVESGFGDGIYTVETRRSESGVEINSLFT